MSGPKLSFHAPLGRRNFLASVGSGMGLLALLLASYRRHVA